MNSMLYGFDEIRKGSLCMASTSGDFQVVVFVVFVAEFVIELAAVDYGGVGEVLQEFPRVVSLLGSLTTIRDDRQCMRS